PVEGTETRSVLLEGHGSWEARARRLAALHRIIRTAGFLDDHVQLTAITGDASARYYARLTQSPAPHMPPAKATPAALVMDWPRQPDGPPIRNALPYSRIAHLAEDVMPFVAIGNTLQAAGFYTPEIRAADLENGFLVLEDLGKQDFK